MDKNLISKQLLDYLLEINLSKKELFPEIREYAVHNKIPVLSPIMTQCIIFLTILHKPETVLEIGTAIGYSSLIFASAMTHGKIDTIELSLPNSKSANLNFEKYKKFLKKKEVMITLHQGYAQKIIPQLKGKYDLIFIDGRKDQYLEYAEIIKPHIQKGTLILADNCLWKGEIFDPEKSASPRNQVIKNFNNFFHDDPNFISVLLPVGDGLLAAYSIQ